MLKTNIKNDSESQMNQMALKELLAGMETELSLRYGAENVSSVFGGTRYLTVAVNPVTRK